MLSILDLEVKYEVFVVTLGKYLYVRFLKLHPLANYSYTADNQSSILHPPALTEAAQYFYLVNSAVYAYHHCCEPNINRKIYMWEGSSDLPSSLLSQSRGGTVSNHSFLFFVGVSSLSIFRVIFDPHMRMHTLLTNLQHCIQGIQPS